MSSVFPGHRARRAAIAAAAALCCAAFSPSTLAQATTQTAPAATVVVTAARAPQLLTDTLPHTTVLLRADIERSQAVDLPALLASEAGVQFAANGGRGTATGLFLRGAPTRQVLVLVDGVPLSRQDASGQVGIEHLMLDQAERIEIVRGNVSALYGAGAVGGVIQIFTRQPTAQPAASLRLEAGARGLVHGGALWTGVVGSTGVALGASRVSDSGFSALDPAVRPAANPDRDGYANTSASLRLTQALAPGHALSAGWLHSDGRLDYDSAFDTPVDVQTSRTRKDLVHLRSDNAVRSGWDSSLTLSTQREDVRQHASGAFGFDSRYRTGNHALNWVHMLALGQGLQASAGIDLQRQTIDVVAMQRQTIDVDASYARGRTVQAAFGSLQWRLGAHDVSAALRQDHVQGVGSRTSGSLGWGWQLAPSWKLIGQVANAFSAPPLGYLHAPFFGNPDLQPELSGSAEAGLQYAAGGQRVRATLFTTRVRQELDYDPVARRFSNIARTRNQGLEVSYDGRIGRADVRASLTAQDPRDADTEDRRVRRSRTLASLAVVQPLGGGFSIGAALRHAGDRPDAGGVMLPAYTVADITAQWDLRRDLQLFGRIENLGDVRYQTANGYNQPPRGVFAGLRWQLPL
jgi:vitamin B12 transporter